ncbi:glycosyltransferase family 25 protein [Ruegeria arenilitoris]|uniref:glycosyltransferase family 25 protein n=1 Tax=Ruegeria arenilitoris TaxID=1173585 RepID=UPI0020C2E0CA|nr:glycosyltransferase family 25 protein [Ruegeria arenilitoris]
MHDTMRSFVIHMSSSTARRPNAEQLCADLPNAELIEAVNGRDPAQIAGVTLHPGNLHRPRYPFTLRPAEIGVFESQRRIWKKMVDENIDLALICEDDLQVDHQRLSIALEMISGFASLDSFVRLPIKQREVPAQTISEKNGVRLILPKVIGLGCVCQVIGRNAAARLLNGTNAIDRPIDVFLQMHWVTGQRIHSVQGTGNQEISPLMGGSTIQTKPPLTDKLTREFKRSAYRAQLHLHPQRPD